MLKRVSLLFLPIFITSCAQFVPPTGGDKDITPPKLIESIPKNGTTNFKDRTIQLAFDELIDATSLRQELIVTPQPQSSYDIKLKSDAIIIVYDKPFLDSTTYTFNFRNGIKDLNEKTPAQNLKLVFSTGAEIDSLSVRGRANYLWNGQIAEDILVGLYQLNSSDTINILQRKPNYFTKTDTSGNFLFENIKSAQYQLIAFDDKNSNLIFDQSKELFTFLLDTIKLDSNISNLQLSLYPHDKTELKVKRSLARRNNYSITFNKDFEKVNVNFPTKDSLTYQIRKEEILFFKHPKTSDTTLTNIIVFDSLGNSIEINQKIYFLESENDKEKPEELRINSQIKPNQYLKKPINYRFNFEYPITTLDTSQILIMGDTTFIEQYNIRWTDPSHTQLEIFTDPMARKEIKLSFAPAALTNYRSDTNKTYTLINRLYPQENFGLIEGKITEDSTQYIVQLIEAQTTETIDYQITTSKFLFQKVVPANYFLRIIKDQNRNNRWDSADFNNRTPPEDIIIYPEILRVKENFELRDIFIN